MNEPVDLAEFQKRFVANQKVDGFGIGNVWVHSPCPFCAAPDFLVFELLEVREVMSREHTCNSCHRSAAAIFTDGPPGTIGFELVQTGGPEQPAWLQSKIRRIDTGERNETRED